MLEVQNLECVRGDNQLFSGLSFTLKPGELLHLKGSNGSGKTSLLRIISGLFTPETGEIRWNGEAIGELREEYNRNLTYVGHLNGIKSELTAVENLRISGQLSALETDEDSIYAALQKIGLEGREELPTKVLSQGQKRRVGLARLLLTKAKLWVLDEPFVALDVAAVQMLQDLIGHHLKNNGMVMMTTHQDVELIADAHQHLNLDS
jgi:heme exporter protein A